MIEEIAPAKINLYLHVGPLRRDGLHEIASLFVFAEDGDRLRAAPARDLSLAIVGPFAGALQRDPVEDNLVLKAARVLRAAAGAGAGAALTLDKRLPIAAGIGGGSSDAAAALRALARLWRVRLPDEELRRLAFALGADVPACLDGRPVAVAGAGERLSPGPSLPPLWAALVNPRVALPTGQVFRAFDRAHPAPEAPRPAPEARISGYRAFVRWLERTRNDLQPIAIARRPEVASALAFLSDRPGGLTARMSGSGATVFGLFSSAEAASRTARAAAGRGWWAMSARIGAGPGRLA
jgi:4-diphosphocytidyl-2-C-methyl-D-erythritol kinase